MCAPVVGAAAPQKAEPVRAKVVAVHPDKALIEIDRGDEAGIHTGDRVVLIDRGAIASHGVVRSVTTKRAHVVCPRNADCSSLTGREAIVITQRDEAATLAAFSSVAYPVTHVDTVLPGGDRVWLTGGTDQGWKTGRAVLLRRGDTLIGWGLVDAATERAALVAFDRQSLSPIPPHRGDTVEAIGTLGTSDRLRTRVTRADGSPDGPSTLTLAGSEHIGIAPGDRFDIFRDGRYVAFAEIATATQPLQAEAPASFRRTLPKPGDVAIRRTKAANVSRAGYVFRVEPDYALITIGEADGIAEGQTLFHARTDGTFDQLTVQRVYPDHCGAVLVNREEDGQPPIKLWARITTTQYPTANSIPRANQPGSKCQQLEQCDWACKLSTPREVGAFVALPDGTLGMVADADTNGALLVRLKGLRYDPSTEP